MVNSGVGKADPAAEMQQGLKLHCGVASAPAEALRQGLKLHCGVASAPAADMQQKRSRCVHWYAVALLQRCTQESFAVSKSIINKVN